ncbi:tetratricopeptide repeat protein [Fundidesulfovibrio soli]|uniref:tetratricopeptide repeat protein n=1 Tax=Fundidesulfovibrio soli TaxID=2922716 RepID=UPI001FAED678|nr:tetratricopeptide repeat protein [Fundidesulfovibrio soli]
MATKALAAGSKAFEAYATSTAIMGRAKFELEILLADMLRELELVPDIKAQLRGPFIYKRGSEKQFSQALAGLCAHLEKLEQAAAEKVQRDRQDRIATFFEKAAEALREKNLPSTRRLLNNVCEQYPDEPGIFSRAARMLADAKLPGDVIPFTERAIEINPKDAAAYGMAVEACQAIGELTMAEKFLREALKNFGAHPKTYVTLAKVLYKMGQWDKAYDAARSALDRDPNLAEAREVVELTEKKVIADRDHGEGLGGFFPRREQPGRAPPQWGARPGCSRMERWRVPHEAAKPRAGAAHRRGSVRAYLISRFLMASTASG